MSVLEDYGTNPVGFLQFFNIWKTNSSIRSFLNTSGLAQAATELLGCKQVRLYQACTQLKLPLSFLHNPTLCQLLLQVGESCANQDE